MDMIAHQTKGVHLDTEVGLPGLQAVEVICVVVWVLKDDLSVMTALDDMIGDSGE